MQPLEKFQMTHDMTSPHRDALSQLSDAQARAEKDLLGGRDALLAEGVRRAEAVLFAAGEPLSAEQVSEILPQGIEAGEVLMALRAVYSKRGVNLVEVAGKWRFQTAQDLSYLFVEERQVQKKLGQAALETLAIIAYGQPVTRAEIEAVRGVAVAKSVIDTLLETGWVRVRGRRKTPGLPITYGTTDKFLEHFGLESLDTLPGKADLEAEGLLSDVIPSGFQMPDEEALSEDDTLIDDLGSLEDVEAFVTDFMQDESVAPAAEPAVAADDEDEDEDAGVVSVFAYTRPAPKPMEDPEAFDRDAVKAAVLKLRNETRVPQQPMHTWRDDE
ncbi:MAG: SMC-Scp complex subunit ScpB [Hyphomonas sp.]|uniref:SMC-Scp complex subunit ScpB n=1 Tax=Hyphomonas sp. TaxID=87 RepID=UPI00178DF878|nr:SMC-Scp complex subunit ScpB [Hyphomonas sp.]MBU3920103.1 SMC-Scp complex subunit ScpB [Alphaproteobacteria bacterium]MBA3067154.1 SMC-Scp complex subunit ScpB [Hyphomonas sp.]MBU4061236.1 SMC-Scp complex subunit ScpB [Alphaproteobacteria bacterium]MBU4165148.1 SMC-Scp complex subunit ScpB [Alphaproteobacteria bacterium]MBU4568126.1 SMC-Scp complex subunit ScpB [Alphaproteobacteria bacterium]